MRLSNNIFNFIKMINNHETTNQNSKALICILVITNVIAFVIVFVLFGEINLLQEKLFQTSVEARMVDFEINEIYLTQKELFIGSGRRVNVNVNVNENLPSWNYYLRANLPWNFYLGFFLIGKILLSKI